MCRKRSVGFRSRPTANVVWRTLTDRVAGLPRGRASVTEGAAGGVIERIFDRLAAGDWTGYAALLSPDVVRIGAWGDRTVGRDHILAMVANLPGTSWVVHRVVYAPDGQSAFARVTAYPARGGLSQFEQTLAFELDADGLVSMIEMFWQTPWNAPPGLRSRASEDG